MGSSGRLFYFIAFLLVHLWAATCQAGTAMSFNIRTEFANDPGELAWEKRKEKVVKIIASANPAILGLQEASANQQQYIVEQLAGNLQAVADSPILYRDATYQLLEKGKVELVEDKWERRFAYWVKLEHKQTGKLWLFISTHWGVDEASQLGSAENLIQALPDLTQNWAVPVLMVGDFNAAPDSKPYKKLAAGTPLKNHFWGLTFTGFKDAAFVQLDYAWAAGVSDITCKSDRFEAYSAPASDHYPIICEFNL